MDELSAATADMDTDNSKPPKHGFVYRLRAYAEHSSIKCLPKMMRASSVVHRILWVLSFVIGTSVALYLLIGLFSLYASYSVTLGVSTEEGAEPPFPDVTVCNLNPLWNSGTGWGLHASIEGVPSALTYDQYIMLLFQNLYQTSQSAFQTTDAELYSASGFLKHTAYDDETLTELGKSFIWKCVWESEDQQRDCVVTSTITPTNGVCYTIRPPDGEGLHVKTRLEGLSVLLFLRNIDLEFVADYRMSPFQRYTEGVQVLLHRRGTAPNMNKGFTVAPGNEASVVAGHVERELLPYPYGECQHGMKLDMFHHIYAENVWQYTEHACRSLCYQNSIIEQCGCLDSTEITFDALTKLYPFCSIYSKLDSTKALAEINCTRNVKADLDAEQSCTKRCPISCTRDYYKKSVNQVPWPHEIYQLGLYTNYMLPNPPSEEFKLYYGTAVNLSVTGDVLGAWRTLRSTDLIQRNFLQLSVTMDDMVTTETDKPAITIEGVIGNLGGILNLWIGFTFITIMEFVDFFLTIAMDRFWGAKIQAGEKRARKPNGNRPDVTMVEPVNYL